MAFLIRAPTGGLFKIELRLAAIIYKSSDWRLFLIRAPSGSFLIRAPTGGLFNKRVRAPTGGLFDKSSDWRRFLNRAPTGGYFL